MIELFDVRRHAQQLVFDMVTKGRVTYDGQMPVDINDVNIYESVLDNDQVWLLMGFTYTRSRIFSVGYNLSENVACPIRFMVYGPVAVLPV